MEKFYKNWIFYRERISNYSCFEKEYKYKEITFKDYFKVFFKEFFVSLMLGILLGIIALIVILLHFSVRVTLEAKTGEKPKIELKYLFFTIYPRKPKKKKKDEDSDKPPEEYKSEFTDGDIEKLLEQAETIDIAEEETKPSKHVFEEKEEKPPEAETEAAKETEQASPQDNIKASEIAETPPAEDNTEPAEEEKKEGAIAKVKRYFNMVKPYIPMAWKYFKKILKTIRFQP